ncbi:MAG TPA: tyrosine-type recombinase/integrase [Pyrinomonadaceae bacterium]|jgi:integrase|nr:tyrosine-type recombinase/integrase [Pyrinomonadaceae bacterium]
MAGQIIRRGDDSWTVRIFLGRATNGKRKYFNHTVRGTKKDAQKLLTAKLREKDLGVLIEPASMPLSEYLAQWLEEVAKSRVRERTFEQYKWLVMGYIGTALGTRCVSDVQPFDVQKFYGDLQKKGLSGRTIRYTHNVFSSAMKQAVKWKMISNNPCDHCDLPRHEKKEMKYLSSEQTNIFLTTAQASKWFVLFLLAIETGMRPEEYLGLQWKDIDFEGSVLVVRRALVWLKGGGFIFTEPKTSRSRRSIPLSNRVTLELRNFKRRQLEKRLILGTEYQNNDLVFASEIGSPLSNKNIANRHFKPLLKKAGLPEIRLYDLRHTTATLLLTANENPKVVSERLGHASISLTLDTYSHVLPTMQKSATEKMERMMSGG